MGRGTQGAPGYWVWEAPGKAVAVHLHLEVVDALLPEVMRGFAAVRKRGAEVGGVLIGSIEPGAPGQPTIVRIEDFEPVECAYRRGPSYLLTDEESARFEDACQRWQPHPSRAHYAVGYFRGHTREGLSLSAEDLELLERYFPQPEQVALLIKPFGTKASQAAFFFREDGAFEPETTATFPFRRRELTGEERPALSVTDDAPHRPLTGGPLTGPEPREQNSRDGESIRVNPIEAGEGPEHARWRVPTWMWIPLTFVFLLLGVLLGFQAAMTVSTRASANAGADFSLALTVAKTGDNLTVRWNREAPAIRGAQRGVLEIDDGAYSKPVELDAANLQNGSIVYRNTSETVRFRLSVYQNARLSVTETMDWRQ